MNNEPELDRSDVTLSTSGRIVSFEEACRRQQIEPDEIVERFGTWAVTTYGLECVNQYYPIEASRLREGTSWWGWKQQMQDKDDWIHYDDFMVAFARAREYHTV
jgi:hypothetical protein